MDKELWDIEREMLLKRISELQDECAYHIQCRKELTEEIKALKAAGGKEITDAIKIVLGSTLS